MHYVKEIKGIVFFLIYWRIRFEDLLIKHKSTLIVFSFLKYGSVRLKDIKLVVIHSVYN